MKKGYQPVPYTQKDAQGKHVKVTNKAEGAAKYFGTAVWGKSEVDGEAQTSDDRQ